MLLFKPEHVEPILAGQKTQTQKSCERPYNRGDISDHRKAKASVIMKATTASERAAAKREAERIEALGHLSYFKELLAAQEQAIKRMGTNRALCQKNVALWEQRIAKMEGKA
jgi:hypothetical protein